jgi:tetratricopeptide (TPR) repeat protein/TolB-like protein
VAVGLLLVVAAGLIGVYRSHWRSSNRLEQLPAEKNLVVLPFTASDNSEQDRVFAEGLATSINARLVQFKRKNLLEIVPATDVRSYKVTDAENARKIFGATLRGRLERFEDRVRIVMTLLDSRSGHQLKTEAVDGNPLQPFEFENRLFSSVARMLEVSPSVEAQPFQGSVVARAYDEFLRGKGYLQMDTPGAIDNAILSFNQALALDHTFALAYSGLGQAYWKKFETSSQREFVEPAQRNCERATTIQPDQVEAHLCLGAVFDGTGQYKKAVAQFQEALDREPASDAAYRGLGLAYQHLGLKEEAEHTYGRAIRLQPRYWVGYSRLGAFYSSEARYSQAAEEYQQATKLAPDNNYPLVQLGGAYYFLGRYTDAIATLQKAIALQPTFESYSNIGLAYEALHQFDDAVANFEQAYQLSPVNYRAVGNLARAYYWAPGKRNFAAPMYEKAERLAQQAISVNSENADAWILLAYYRAMLGRKSEARPALERALRMRPSDPEFAFFAALVHQQFHEPTETLDSLTQAIQRGYSPQEVGTAVEFDDLHDNATFRALLKSASKTDTQAKGANRS